MAQGLVSFCCAYKKAQVKALQKKTVGALRVDGGEEKDETPKEVTAEMLMKDSRQMTEKPGTSSSGMILPLILLGCGVFLMAK